MVDVSGVDSSLGEKNLSFWLVQNLSLKTGERFRTSRNDRIKEGVVKIAQFDPINLILKTIYNRRDLRHVGSFRRPQELEILVIKM